VAQEVFLRDVLDIPESVHSGDFKIDLTKGFDQTKLLVGNYVVTDQLLAAFREALDLVRTAVRDGNSHAAYLHGSFGSGKSHFLTVLHAVLNNDKAAREKAKLRPVIAEHDEWLPGRKFLMVPRHLVGSADLDSALLGGYVQTIRSLHPEAPTPPVYRADAMLDDAQRLRVSVGDAKFIEMLGGEDADLPDPDDLVPYDGKSGAWTSDELDAAFTTQAGDQRRDKLVSALLSGPMAAYARGAQGDKEAFLPLENGLAVISRHAQKLGYDGIVLFLDELILWLQAHMSQREFVNDQVSKLVKLIESGDNDRPVPIVSFISRQRDLTQLVGTDVMGADVRNLEQQVQYLAERFDTISLEDRNLPAIIKERVLKPRPEARALLDNAFKSIESTNPAVKDALLDANGATQAGWDDFRAVYPISPALLNVLVALSGALQRERTGLKLLQDMLHRRRADMKLGELIPLGDLWDVLSQGSTAAFTDRLRTEAEAAQRFHQKVRARLEQKYGSTTDSRFIADERLVKTLLLASLAPEVSALTRLTGRRLAALNHGSIKSRTVEPGTLAIRNLRDLQADFGELRAEGDEDPVFSLHLSDLDIEPMLDAVNDVDTAGARRIWVKTQLWNAMNVKIGDSFVSEREVVWHGSRRTVEFVFENVRDTQTLPDVQFDPSLDGVVRFVVDYPFDEPDKYPIQDVQRIEQLHRRGRTKTPTVVWLPAFWSEQRSNQLGRLLRINYLLERGRLDTYAANLSTDDRIRVKNQLQVQQGNLESALKSVLNQLYGLSSGDKANLRDPDSEPGQVLSLHTEHKPRLHGGASFEYNIFELTDSMFDTLYPKHPNLDPKKDRKAVTTGELKTALNWITRAAEQGGRVELERNQLAPMRKIVHPLGLGEVHDGPMTLNNEWKTRIEQHAAKKGETGDFHVEEIRKWIADLGVTGLDKQVANLIIASYALLADRSWVYNGVPSEAPELDRIGTGWFLRAQELPTNDEFEQARTRAGRLFGVSAPAVLFARNITKLAAGVQEKVHAQEGAVHGLHQSLTRHADDLGIDPTAPRAVATRAAAELLAKLSGFKDPTQLVKALAALPDPDGDPARSRTMASAQQVLDALDRAQWDLLDTVRPYLSRNDGIRDRTERLLTDIADTARAEEFTTSLTPVLDEARGVALKIIRDATPPDPGPGPTPLPPPPPVTGQAKRLKPGATSADLAATMKDVQTSIAELASQHADQEIEISWRLVDRGGTA